MALSPIKQFTTKKWLENNPGDRIGIDMGKKLSQIWSRGLRRKLFAKSGLPAN
jgi:hypothetical protein